MTKSRLLRAVFIGFLLFIVFLILSCVPKGEVDYIKHEETGRDGRFIAYINGTVLDTKTNLMWASKDNGQNITWEDAKNYCGSYDGGGYTDWRMPTIKELSGIYDSKQNNYYHVTELINITACCLWTSETWGREALYFVFHSGLQNWGYKVGLGGSRVLPVRVATTEEILETDPIELSNQGENFIEEGQYDRAIAYLNKAIEINPRYAKAYSYRGSAYAGKGHYDKAISDCNKAIAINPRDAHAYGYRGIVHFNKGQYDKAISDFNKAIEINPRDAEVYNSRGGAYLAKGKINRTISDCNKAIEINPKLVYAYNSRGIAYLSKGQYNKAISDLNMAIEINPRYAEAYNSRGNVFGKMGQYDKAISDFNKAIEINPIYAVAYNSRAIAYFYIREYDKAWNDVHEAQNLGYNVHPGFLEALRQSSGREK